MEDLLHYGKTSGDNRQSNEGNRTASTIKKIYLLYYSFIKLAVTRSDYSIHFTLIFHGFI